MNYENGVDLNFDGHCDLCGKFVDKYGHHRVSAVFDDVTEKFELWFIDFDNEYEKMDNYDLTNKYFAANPYRNPKSYYGSRFWSEVQDYTSAEVASLTSAISINKFLRDGVLTYGQTMDNVYEKTIHIEMAIDDFELRTTLVTYRGISVNSDSPICDTLNRAYTSLKEGKTFDYVDKGLVSTTTSIEYATARTKSPGNVKIKMAIIMHKGQKCMPLVKRFGTTYDDREKEVLIKSNQMFEIISVQRYKKNTFYYYNVVMLLKGDND